MDSESEEDNIIVNEDDIETDTDEDVSGEYIPPEDYPDENDSLVLEFEEYTKNPVIYPYYEDDSYSKSLYRSEEDYMRKEINRITEILKLYMIDYELEELQEFSLHIVNKKFKKIEYPSELEEILNSIIENLTEYIIGY